MNTLALEIAAPTAESVTLTNDTLTVELSDGRSLSVPLDWFPRLIQARQAERKRWRLIGRGRGIHWDLLDEDIGVDGLLAGRPSRESQASFQKWLATRQGTVPNVSPLAKPTVVAKVAAGSQRADHSCEKPGVLMFSASCLLDSLSWDNHSPSIS